MLLNIFNIKLTYYRKLLEYRQLSEKKFPRDFEECLEFSLYIKIFIYVFILRLLTEPSAMFHGIVVRKQCCRPSGVEH